MSDTRALIEKYVANWHEPDAEVRRKAITEAWAEDGIYSNQNIQFHGHAGVEEAVTQAYESFVQNGFVFRVAKVDTNHDTVRYVWEMFPARGGKPASAGTHVIRIGPDGRWVREHQFIDLAPPPVF